ncbi:MarR family transcriptional regulator [Aureimonas sp. ME7]|uniref:MarR family winged helix-turn-helix transcriptional regulator n=1 Tax=Aureimonas sp. ME7 TaxID=2744252 RepID=UPI0015F3CD22|nr:MarR family transcriptional regulator [Aureimonas sp. ME7]
MGQNSRPLPLDDHLCFALYGASMAIGRLYKPILDEWGITYPQYLVLASLWERDDRLIGELAERLALEPSTITPLVTRLEGAGLVRRERDPTNGRQVIVHLTREGQALSVKAACLGAALMEAAGIDPARLSAMRAEARALRDAIAAHGDADARKGASAKG